MSTSTPLGKKASASNASQQAANSLGSNINQKSQIACPKQTKTTSPEITKKTKSSSKKHTPPKEPLNESNYPPELNLFHKKLSENMLQREAI